MDRKEMEEVLAELRETGTYIPSGLAEIIVDAVIVHPEMAWSEAEVWDRLWDFFITPYTSVIDADTDEEIEAYWDRCHRFLDAYIERALDRAAITHKYAVNLIAAMMLATRYLREEYDEVFPKTLPLFLNAGPITLDEIIDTLAEVDPSFRPVCVDDVEEYVNWVEENEDLFAAMLSLDELWRFDPDGNGNYPMQDIIVLRSQRPEIEQVAMILEHYTDIEW